MIWEQCGLPVLDVFTLEINPCEIAGQCAIDGLGSVDSCSSQVSSLGTFKRVSVKYERRKREVPHPLFGTSQCIRDLSVY
jgi:hypothetical protein